MCNKHTWINLSKNVSKYKHEMKYCKQNKICCLFPKRHAVPEKKLLLQKMGYTYIRVSSPKQQETVGDG